MEQSNYFARSYLPINCNCYSCSCCFLCFIFCFNFASTFISLSFRQSLVLGAKISVSPSAAAASFSPPDDFVSVIWNSFFLCVCVWKRTFQKKRTKFSFFSNSVVKFSNFQIFYYFFFLSFFTCSASSFRFKASRITIHSRCLRRVLVLLLVLLSLLMFILWSPALIFLWILNSI